MFRILADVTVPGETSPHSKVMVTMSHTCRRYRNSVRKQHDAIAEYATSEGIAILSNDLKDFGRRDFNISLFVAPQTISGGEIRAAVAQIEALPFDPAESELIWLSAL